MKSKQKKTICFDLDNVICKTIGNQYKTSKPIKKNIMFINNLYDRGYIIKIYTARFMGRAKDNLELAKKRASKITISQLKKWKVKYHKIFFGKPSFDIFIDDKSLFFQKNWIKHLKNNLNEK